MLAGTVNNIIAVTAHNRPLYTAEIIIKDHDRQHRRCLLISHLASYRAIFKKNQSTRRLALLS
jgi:hypothetical protein